MTIVDDRTPETRSTHTVLVAMTDSFLSGWGQAAGGVSYAAWACRPEDECYVRDWVKSRGDAKRVRIVGPDWRPRGRGHCHIYVVGDRHASLPTWRRAQEGDPCANA